MAKNRISEAGLLIGYAMSRLDRRMLDLLDCTSLEATFVKAAQILGEKPQSIRLLRDEFDPFLENTRRGFVGRPPREPIAALIYEMQSVSDGALEAMVMDALAGNDTALEAVREIVHTKPERLANVAERLQTGAFAERFFIDNSQGLVGVPYEKLHDARLDACGYDFALAIPPQTVFEIKGLNSGQGGLLFTDKEWQTAQRLGSAYHLVVVQDIATQPHASVLVNPAAKLNVQMVTEQRTVISWRSNFSRSI